MCIHEDWQTHGVEEERNRERRNQKGQGKVKGLLNSVASCCVILIAVFMDFLVFMSNQFIPPLLVNAQLQFLQEFIG